MSQPLADCDPAPGNAPGVAARVAITVLRGYKLLLSPVFTGACRFHPSCSSYMAEAIRRHGVIRGLGLATWRLLRCNPWSRGGYDPVPGDVHSHQEPAVR